MIKFTQDREKINYQAVVDPKPGDYWTERCLPYFMVVNVQGLKITILNCLSSDNHKDWVCAKIQNDNGTWEFDYSKTMTVDRAWIEALVMYKSIDGFIADVSRLSTTGQLIVNEWIEYRADLLYNELQSMGGHATMHILKKTTETV